MMQAFLMTPVKAEVIHLFAGWIQGARKELGGFCR
jgi:hypothetical protein